MRVIVKGAMLAAAVSSSAPLAQAQEQARGTIELGVDAYVGQTTQGSTSLTVVDVPFRSARLGVFLSERVELEPSVTFQYLKLESSRYADKLTLGRVGVLYHFTTDRRAPQLFLRPTLGYLQTSGVSRQGGPALGVGGGIKLPIGERFLFRGSGDLEHIKVSKRPSSRRLGVLLGFSVLTR